VVPAAAKGKGKADKSKPAEKPKPKGKPVYTGPTEVITLAPTPMLDEEGKQLLDPDGNPMFNAPVTQMRDKQGHPMFDASGKPVFRTAKDAGYDARGKKIPVKKEKVVKKEPVVISRGTFTVDGMIGKAELNYTIPDFKFIYLYVPGLGTVIVSNVQFPGGTLQKDAFRNNSLKLNIEDHDLELASDRQIIGKQGHPLPAYIEVDRDFRLPSKFPAVGFGTTTAAPYAWPGAKRNTQLAGTIKPPPTPKNLLPAELLAKCPDGQMRMPAPPVLPGEVAPEQPCVAIPEALKASSSGKGKSGRGKAAKAEESKSSEAAPATVAPTAEAPAATPPPAEAPPAPAQAAPAPPPQG
jgi:hypothetical protein